MVSNRDWVEDDYFEITAEEEACCACCKCCCCCGTKAKQVPVRYGVEGSINRSDEFPERVLKEEREVEEKDMSYLTIGIVVNAPYGRRDRVLNE